MFDTLPINVEEVALVPGDLIFYEGTYLSTRCKPQKHNIVHVEVFLGNESTIGARLKRGVVSIFPSYKFESTSWTLTKCHFKSLDTWLDGQCASVCTEHQWIEENPSVNAGVLKSSVFHYDSDEESAGDDSDVEEEDGDDDVGPTTESLSAPNDCNTLPPITHREVNGSIQSTIASTDKINRKEKTKSLLSYMDRKTPLTYYVNKSNGWRLVKEALDKRGWQQLPFESKRSVRYNLKWVERRSDIDYKAHVEGQLVCHFPNNDCITTKASLLRTMKEYQSKLHGVAVDNVTLPWLPDSYDLDAPADCELALQANDKQVAATGNNITWIYKPASNNRGRGIIVFRGKDKLIELCRPQPEELNAMIRPVQRGVLQRYIEEPLLVFCANERVKFDIRCYLLIATSTPSFLCFYHAGYCRLSLKPYSVDETTLDDAAVHLTNAAVQKKDPKYQEKKELQIQTPEAIALLFEAQGDIDSAKYFRECLDRDIKKCMKDVLKASLHKLPRKHGYFDLLGFDFMITSLRELKLLEINTNPAMSLDNSTLQTLLPQIIDDTIQIVLDTQGPEKPTHEKNNPLLSIPGKFELIYSEIEETKSFQLPSIRRTSSTTSS